jgi:hypothetical protein
MQAGARQMQVKTNAAGVTRIVLLPGDEYEDFVQFLACAVTHDDPPVVQKLFKRLVEQ